MKLHRVSIPNGAVTLAGLAYEPEAAPRLPCVVLSHGYTASKESLDLLAAYLCGRGHACLTYDFRGHLLGHSTGALNHAEDALDDLRAAMDFAKSRFESDSCVLAGHSMGALISLAVAAERDDVPGVAAITVGPNPSRAFTSSLGAAMLAQRAAYVIGAEPAEFLRELDDLARFTAQIAPRPSLFVAAKGDVLVKPEKVRGMAEEAGPNALYVEIEGGHLEAPERARGAVANWLQKNW